MPTAARYDTQNGLARHLTRTQRLRRVFRPRVIVHTAVLLLIVSALATSITLRSPFRVDIVRDRATLARQVEDGEVENVYRLQIMNATELPQSYRVTAEGLPGLRVVGSRSVTVAPTEAKWVSATLRVPAQTAAGTAPGVHEIHFTIEREAQGGEASRALREKSTFVLPR